MQVLVRYVIAYDQHTRHTRYAHMPADHLAPYADKPAPLRGPDAEINGTNPSQPAKQKGPTRR